MFAELLRLQRGLLTLHLYDENDSGLDAEALALKEGNVTMAAMVTKARDKLRRSPTETAAELVGCLPAVLSWL